MTNKIEILFTHKTACLQGFSHKKRPQGISSSRSVFLFWFALFLMNGVTQKHRELTLRQKYNIGDILFQESKINIA